LELSISQQQLVQRLEELKAEVDAVVNKANAVSPQLISALQSFSDRALAGKMAESMAPLAILGGKSIAEVFSNLLKGTVLEKVITQVEKTTEVKPAPVKK
jgi:major vault protein